jgi:hypothetical protein
MRDDGERACGDAHTVLAVVLRLLGERLRDGEITGWLEIVATGDRRAVRDADDLLAALRTLGSSPPPGERD